MRNAGTYWHNGSMLKNRDITLPTKVHLVKAMVFPVVMYGCASWTMKKAECQRIDAFWTVVLEKTLESPLDCREIQLVHPKRSQPWIFTGRTNTEAETPVLCPPNVKSWLIWKDPDAGKDWRREKGTTEDKMAGWHHQLDGREFEQASRVGDGQGGLVCCSPWGHKESDTTEALNWSGECSLILDCKASFHWYKSQHFHAAYRYVSIKRPMWESRVYRNLFEGQSEEGTKDKKKIS